MRVRDHILALLVGLHVLLMLAFAATNFRAPKDAEGLLAEWSSVRKQVRAVARPYGDYLGMSQRWKMFTRVGRGVSHIEIAVRQNGQWHDVFIERSTKHTWNAAAFEQNRWREYNNRLRGKKRSKEWRVFVPWVARRALDDYPEADAVRVRVMGGKMPSPEKLKKRGKLKLNQLRKVDIVERSEL